MLSRFDDYPIHQTPEPVAHPATSDRNVYDRYWFNGYAPDGEFYFGVTLGRYAHLGVLDCGFSIVRDGEQHAFHASRRAPAEPTETRVGPFHLEVLEPMRRTRVRLEPNETGIECDLVFHARTACVEEGRQTRHAGMRVFMDATRFAQFGRWEGEVRWAGRSLQVDPARVTNLVHVDDRWRDMFPGARDYAVPYFWGTLGIGYRADLVPEPITSWQQLFRPAEPLRGRIGMIGDPFDLLGMALKALGYSANSADRRELAEAERLLHDQKPYVRTYRYVSLTEESSLVTGEVAASMMYSGDALMVAEHHDEIVYVVPEEGGNIWIDYLVVMASSSKKQAAKTFINFLNEPENAAQLAEYVYYATPNLAAERLLPKEFLEDPTIYPSRSVLERSEFYTELPPRADKRRNTIFSGVVH